MLSTVAEPSSPKKHVKKPFRPSPHDDYAYFSDFSLDQLAVVNRIIRLVIS